MSVPQLLPFALVALPHASGFSDAMDSKPKDVYSNDVKIIDTDSEACASEMTIRAGLQRRMKNRHIAMIRYVSVNVGRPFRRFTRTSAYFLQYWRCVHRLLPF